jgi:hypothetical protein
MHPEQPLESQEASLGSVCGQTSPLSEQDRKSEEPAPGSGPEQASGAASASDVDAEPSQAAGTSLSSSPLPAQLASGSASAESLSGRQNAEASCGAAQSNIASREPKLTEYRGHAVADIASKIVAATVSNDRTRAETETHEPNPGTVRPRRRWVWWVVVGIGVLGLVIGPIGVWLTTVWFGGLAQLESAMAEADAIYPHWRWEDLIRQREQVPPEENAWPLIEQIAERYRANPHARTWEGKPIADRRAQPNRRSHDQLQLVRQLVNADPHLVALFASLSTYDKAQPPVPCLAVIPWETPLPHREVLSAFRGCLPVLHDYFIVTGRMADADMLLRTAWKIAASADEDPFVEGQKTGMFLEKVVLGELEQRLALGEMSPGLLEEMQQILDKRLVINHQRALWMVRSERALTHELFTNIYRASLTWQQLVNVVTGSAPYPKENWLETAKQWFRYQYFLWGLKIKQPRIHAFALRYCNSLEPAARISEEELDRELRRGTGPRPTTDDEIWWLNVYVYYRFDDSLHAVCGWLLLSREHLLAARAGLAAERFRLEQGRLPKDWDELVPQYLPDVPQAAYSGGPLRFKTSADGIVIYSVGRNRHDDGGDPDHDVAFRLYHRDKRNLLLGPRKRASVP